MILGNPDVTLTLQQDADADLVLGYRRNDEITALATADSGRLELYRGEFNV